MQTPKTKKLTRAAGEGLGGGVAGADVELDDRLAALEDGRDRRAADDPVQNGVRINWWKAKMPDVSGKIRERLGNGLARRDVGLGALEDADLLEVRVPCGLWEREKAWIK